MIDILLLLIPMAMVDSLNPHTIAIHFFLLTTKNPLGRLAGHLIGIFLTYLIGGFLLIMGIGQILKPLLSLSLSYEIILIGHAIELAIGLLIIYYGYTINKNKEGLNKRIIEKAGSITFGQSFSLGFVATIGDILTAVIYLPANVLIANAKLGFLENFLLLLVYNSIYVLPLIILWSLLFFKKTALVFHNIREFIKKWFSTILVIILILIGILLIIDSIGRFLAHPLF
ncbi:MAG: GAP family protein [bacterium]